MSENDPADFPQDEAHQQRSLMRRIGESRAVTTLAGAALATVIFAGLHESDKTSSELHKHLDGASQFGAVEQYVDAPLGYQYEIQDTRNKIVSTFLSTPIINAELTEAAKKEHGNVFSFKYPRPDSSFVAVEMELPEGITADVVNRRQFSWKDVEDITVEWVDARQEEPFVVESIAFNVIDEGSRNPLNQAPQVSDTSGRSNHLSSEDESDVNHTTELGEDADDNYGSVLTYDYSFGKPISSAFRLAFVSSDQLMHHFTSTHAEGALNPTPYPIPLERAVEYTDGATEIRAATDRMFDVNSSWDTPLDEYQ